MYNRCLAEKLDASFNLRRNIYENISNRKEFIAPFSNCVFGFGLNVIKIYYYYYYYYYYQSI